MRPKLKSGINSKKLATTVALVTLVSLVFATGKFIASEFITKPQILRVISPFNYRIQTGLSAVLDENKVLLERDVGFTEIVDTIRSVESDGGHSDLFYLHAKVARIERCRGVVDATKNPGVFSTIAVVLRDGGYYEVARPDIDSRADSMLRKRQEYVSVILFVGWLGCNGLLIFLRHYKDSRQGGSRV